MIGRSERAEWAATFGVAPEQVQRDHLISHLLAGLADTSTAEDVFYGGTALCRSHLEGSRLSEDVDLLHPKPVERSITLEAGLRGALRRELPDLEWSWTERGAGQATALVGTPDTAPVRVDLRRPDAVVRWWEFVPTRIQLRYGDVPEVVMLRCPTLESFVGMKMAAWVDRHAPRDLFDLAGLAGVGAFTDGAEARYRQATGVRFLEVEFAPVPAATERAWDTELGAQVGRVPRPEECAATVLAQIRGLHQSGG